MTAALLSSPLERMVVVARVAVTWPIANYQTWAWDRRAIFFLIHYPANIMAHLGGDLELDQETGAISGDIAANLNVGAGSDHTEALQKISICSVRCQFLFPVAGHTQRVGRASIAYR